MAGLPLVWEKLATGIKSVRRGGPFLLPCSVPIVPTPTWGREPVWGNQQPLAPSSRIPGLCDTFLLLPQVVKRMMRSGDHSC